MTPKCSWGLLSAFLSSPRNQTTQDVEPSHDGLLFKLLQLLLDVYVPLSQLCWNPSRNFVLSCCWRSSYLLTKAWNLSSLPTDLLFILKNNWSQTANAKKLQASQKYSQCSSSAKVLRDLYHSSWWVEKHRVPLKWKFLLGKAAYNGKPSRQIRSWVAVHHVLFIWKKWWQRRFLVPMLLFIM